MNEKQQSNDPSIPAKVYEIIGRLYAQLWTSSEESVELQKHVAQQKEQIEFMDKKLREESEKKNKDFLNNVIDKLGPGETETVELGPDPPKLTPKPPRPGDGN